MEITKIKLKYYCGKHIPMFNVICGSWSLKHNEWYYCEECILKNRRWLDRQEQKNGKEI